MIGKNARARRGLSGERVERTIDFTSGWLSSLAVVLALKAHGLLAGFLIALAVPGGIAFVRGFLLAALRDLRPAGATCVALYDRYGQRETLPLEPPLPAGERVVRFGFVTEENP